MKKLLFWGLVILATILVLLVAIPNVLHDSRISNEARAISNVAVLSVAQVAFQAVEGHYAQSIEQLTAEDPPYIDKSQFDPKYGYFYTLNVRGNGDATFTVKASPLEPGVSGRKSFFRAGGGKMRFDDGDANESSPAIPNQVLQEYYGLDFFNNNE